MTQSNGFEMRMNGARHGILCLGLILSLFLPRHIAAQHHHQEHGKVDFPISCNDEAQSHFDVGLALLHHMMYDQAHEHFAQAVTSDETCAMAHWGIAMTSFHPLWEPPTDKQLETGSTSVTRALALEAATDRERAHVDAVAQFFHQDGTSTFSQRLSAWKEGQRAVHEAHPDDVDAAAFYALALLATAPRDDRTFARQEKAGALLENLLERAPHHPGLFHYTIHAYDNPVLAEKGVSVARAYDQLAPDVPHALHMPSHIFVRLGYWPETAEWNERSAEAALRQPVGDYTSLHYAHALDYLMYAYLQQGRDDAAGEVLDRVFAAQNHQPGFAAAYGLAAAPARYVLERRAWDEAARLPVRAPEDFAWDRFPAAEAITHFARGIGSARSGDEAGARAAIEALDRIHARIVEARDDYWGVIVDAQRKSVAAWLAKLEGDTDRALETMRIAADTEDSVDKSPVTPSAVLPARELLGDMLRILERPAEAMEAYEAALAISPNRYNSLYGAGRAAQIAGREDVAKTYFTRLVELTEDSTGERPGREHAQSFLVGSQ